MSTSTASIVLSTVTAVVGLLWGFVFQYGSTNPFRALPLPAMRALIADCNALALAWRQVKPPTDEPLSWQDGTRVTKRCTRLWYYGPKVVHLPVFDHLKPEDFVPEAFLTDNPADEAGDEDLGPIKYPQGTGNSSWLLWAALYSSAAEGPVIPKAEPQTKLRRTLSRILDPVRDFHRACVGMASGGSERLPARISSASTESSHLPTHGAPGPRPDIRESPKVQAFQVELVKCDDSNYFIAMPVHAYFRALLRVSTEFHQRGPFHLVADAHWGTTTFVRDAQNNVEIHFSSAQSRFGASRYTRALLVDLNDVNDATPQLLHVCGWTNRPGKHVGKELAASMQHRHSRGAPCGRDGKKFYTLFILPDDANSLIAVATRILAYLKAKRVLEQSQIERIEFIHHDDCTDSTERIKQWALFFQGPPVQAAIASLMVAAPQEQSNTRPEALFWQKLNTLKVSLDEIMVQHRTIYSDDLEKLQFWLAHFYVFAEKVRVLPEAAINLDLHRPRAFAWMR